MSYTGFKMRVNPKSLLNLKPIKPGESRGPRTAGASIKECLNALFSKKRLTETELKKIARSDPSLARRVAARQCLKALKDDHPTVKLLMEQTDGLPRQPVEHSVAGTDPVALAALLARVAGL